MNRPWHKRADELENKEGLYCDFIAWREWFQEQEDKIVDCDILVGMDWFDTASLYSIFCKVYDDLPDMPEIVEVKP